MTTSPLAVLVRDTAVRLLAGRIEADALDVLAPDGGMRRSRRAEHGEYTCTLALQVAAVAGIAPLELAGLLAAALREQPAVAAATAAGRGFVIIALTPVGQAAEASAALGPAGGAAPTGAAPGPGDGTGPVEAPPCAHAPAIRVRPDVRGRPDGARTHAGEVGGDRVSTTAGLRTMAELAAEFGRDTARLAVVSAARSGRPLDLALLWRRTHDNPVFRWQHAHARLAALQRAADALGMAEHGRPDLLDTADEHDLIAVLVEPPPRDVAARAHGLDRLAAAAHRFCDAHRAVPSGDEPPTAAHRARLALAAAARRALAARLAGVGAAAAEHA